jgi:hypothetical protein
MFRVLCNVNDAEFLKNTLFYFCPVLNMLFENISLFSKVFFYTEPSADCLAQKGSYLPTLAGIISGIFCTLSPRDDKNLARFSINMAE